MNGNNKGLDRRIFLKVGGMSTVALTLGTTGLFSLAGDIMPNGDKVPAMHDGMAALKMNHPKKARGTN